MIKDGHRIESAQAPNVGHQKSLGKRWKKGSCARSYGQKDDQNSKSTPRIGGPFPGPVELRMSANIEKKNNKMRDLNRYVRSENKVDRGPSGENSGDWEKVYSVGGAQKSQTIKAVKESKLIASSTRRRREEKKRKVGLQKEARIRKKGSGGRRAHTLYISHVRRKRHYLKQQDQQEKGKKKIGPLGGRDSTTRREAAFPKTCRSGGEKNGHLSNGAEKQGGIKVHW